MPQRIGLTVTLRRAAWGSLIIGVYSLLALFKSYPLLSGIPPLPVALDAAVSFAMALLIAFRVNRAYERWWEARTLWGTLVNVSRNLAVKVRQLVPADRDDDREARQLIIDFCYALKDHLRDGADSPKLSKYSRAKHVPAEVVSRLYGLFARWQRDDQINELSLLVIDREARELLDICGACERIKYTLMSISWRRFTHQIILVYLLFLPWGLVDEFGGWTIPMVIVASYFVLGGESIAEYIEEPFGHDEDHLHLDALCETIETTVIEIFAADSITGDPVSGGASSVISETAPDISTTS